MGLLNGLFSGGGFVMNNILKPLLVLLSAYGLFLAAKKSLLLGLVSALLLGTGLPAAVGGMSLMGIDLLKPVMHHVKLPW